MTCVNDHYSFFHSPIDDYLGLMGHSQHIFRCRELELNVLDCTDVYGRKGLKKQCMTHYEDFLECLYSKKQFARVTLMQQERLRQYYSGERKKKDYWAPSPLLDGYDKTYTTSID